MNTKPQEKSPSLTRNQFTFWKEIEVRWGDMDALGHVNNTVYFVYLEAARVEFLRRMGFKGRECGAPQGPTLVSISCDFKKQVVYPAMLDIGVRIEAVGERSFRLSYGIFFHGTDELVAPATSVNAWVDYTTGRAVELPAELRAAFEQYQKAD